ncbi:ATP-binding protein [Streptomyces sp. NPDC001922]|uniref:sensor histidine kinase n=1 Tax=Streptomyces sp. NPDC001922 TaxID=3364624 RepID=UPI00368EDC85
MPEPPTHAARPEPRRPTAPTGKRHGRSPAQDGAADSAIRSRMQRLAVLPALCVGAVSTATTVFVLRSQEGFADGTTWGVLAGAAALGCGALAGGAVAANAEARATSRRYTALRRAGSRGQADLHDLLRRLGQGERLQPRPQAPLPEPSGDSLDLLAHEFALAQRQAETAVVQAAQLVRGKSEGSEEKVEVFVNLARRLQSLVHREIELLDELENEVEDPDLLKGLFHVDHLATRIRRHAENLAVLGGAISRRQWSRPVTMTEVLRSSIAEVEQYSRVKLVPPIDGTLRGHAVADVIHLLAELVENATVFSAPQTQVLLRAQRVSAGLAVEVEDRGLGMPREEQLRMNALLTDPDRIDVGELLRDGRIGLFVVSALARRHGIAVQLQSNIYGGIQAVLVLPQSLLGDQPGESTPAAAPAGTASHDATSPLPAASPLPPAAPAPSAPPVQPAGPAGPAGSPAASPPPVPHRAAPGAAQPPVPPGHVPQLPVREKPVREAPVRPAPARPAVPHAEVPRAEVPRAEVPRPAAPQPGAGQQQPLAMPTPIPQQHARAAEPPRPAPRHSGPVPSPAQAPEPPSHRDRGPVHPADARGERPQLPRRRRQEHIVPELRDAPTARSTGSEQEAEHDPNLMAAFRRGVSLAEAPDAPDESHADRSR